MTLLADAKHGYATVGENPHLWSTPECIAFAVGRWIKEKGLPVPKSIEAGRGYSMTVDGSYRVTWHAGEVRRIESGL